MKHVNAGPGWWALAMVASSSACHLVSNVDDLQYTTSTTSSSTATATGPGGSGAGGATVTSTSAVTGTGGAASTTTGTGGAATTTVASGSGGSGGSGGNGGSGCPTAPSDAPASCVDLPVTCGSDSLQSCCTSDIVTGGSFKRDHLDSLPASVSTFKLDRFEATVGRYRKFVDAVVIGKWKPAAGAGKHGHLNCGIGLDGELGWLSTWNEHLLDTTALWNAALACPGESLSSYETWTPAAGANEKKPISCINWYQAHAFCIWDGGFLPTENELNYASATTEKRLYPWGNTTPTASYAVWFCGNGNCSKTSDELFNVGSKPLGDGLFKTADLAGNVAEWALDLWQEKTSKPTPCVDCATPPTGGVEQGLQRGGSFGSNLAADLGNAGNRYLTSFTIRGSGIGVRCARQP